MSAPARCWPTSATERRTGTRARDLYTLLEAAPEAADIVPREKLVQRRAVLADRQGDAAEAEALYRELAILNPQHVGARKALAELARARGDLPGAVQRLEEVLRLMPSDAGGELLDVRQRLGALHAELGEWDSARHYLELVVAQDPGARARAGAAAGSVRPARHARGGRQGVRAAGPPLLRAVAARRRPLSPGGDPARAAGQFGGGAGRVPALVGPGSRASFRRACASSITSGTSAISTWSPSSPTTSDGVPLSPDNEPDLVARLAIATTTLRAGARSALPVHAGAGAGGRARDGRRRRAIRSRRHRSIEALDGMLTRARIWAGADGEQTAVRDADRHGPRGPGTAGRRLCAGPVRRAGRPSRAGARRVRAGRVRRCPSCPAARHISALASPGYVQPEAVAIGGPADHPDIRVPARRALAGLAAALLGYGHDVPAPKPTEGSGLPPARATELRRIGDLIASPPFIVVRDATGATTADERRRLRVIPTQPAGLLIAASTPTLSENSWSFVAGRALETLRSGLRTSGLAGAEGLARLLEGARAVLADAPGGRTAGPRRRRLAAAAGGDAAARLRRDARGDPGRRRGGAGVAARLADVHARRDAHAQPHRPAGVHQPRRRPHRAQGR